MAYTRPETGACGLWSCFDMPEEDITEEVVRLVGALFAAKERAEQHAANIRESAALVMGVGVAELDDWSLEYLMAYADLAPAVEDAPRGGPKFRGV